MRKLAVLFLLVLALGSTACMGHWIHGGKGGCRSAVGR